MAKNIESYGGLEWVRKAGRDYTDEDLIAPWDPTRTQLRRKIRRDDLDRDDDRDNMDCDDPEPIEVAKP